MRHKLSWPILLRELALGRFNLSNQRISLRSNARHLKKERERSSTHNLRASRKLVLIGGGTSHGCRDGQEMESAMNYDRGTVFVLGAGFTKAFLKNAPLGIDDYDADRKLEKLFAVDEFPRARSALMAEKRSNKDNKHNKDGKKINIEMLMTRLRSGMPFDRRPGVAAELNLLFDRLEATFYDRLKAVMNGPLPITSELWSFAEHLVANRIQGLTFNYDWLLDDLLWPGFPPNNDSPGSRFGFTSPNIKLFSTDGKYEQPTSARLFKLHGSLDWRVAVGTPRPYPIDAVKRFRDSNAHGNCGYDPFRQHLDPKPFIVLPVLTKTELMEQPVLQALWSAAFEELKYAKAVVFIGYSLPTTDIAATLLFRETLLGEKEPGISVQIVDWEANPLEPAARRI